MSESKMQRRETSHREPNDMRAVNAEMIQQRADVVGGAVLRIGCRTWWHVGRLVTSRVERDATVALAEMAHLWLPAAVIPGELVHEDQRLSGTCFLIVQ